MHLFIRENICRPFEHTINTIYDQVIPKALNITTEMNMEPTDAQEIAKLYIELRERKNALARLLEAKESMLRYEAVRLEADYMNKVGNEENEIAELELKLNRAHRKIEIIRDLIENKEKIDIETIDAQIDLEFLLNEEDRKFAENMYDLSGGTMQEDFPEEKINRFKEMYHDFAKNLHPDINPNLTESELNLWHKVQDVYRNRDIEEMETLYELYQKTFDTEEDLKKDIQNRIEKIRDLTHKTFVKIADIEQSFPFTFEEQLNDDEWLLDKTALNQKIKKQLMEDYSFTQHLLNMMLKSAGIIDN